MPDINNDLEMDNKFGLLQLEGQTYQYDMDIDLQTKDTNTKVYDKNTDQTTRLKIISRKPPYILPILIN